VEQFMDLNRTLIVRWVARIWSLASLLIILLFVIGEGIGAKTAREWAGLFFFPFGISVGMILAWWKEGIGGITTAASLMIFYGIHLATTGTFPKGWAWLVFAAPGFLFLLSSYWSAKVRGGPKIP
jgi:hypothetical protein